MNEAQAIIRELEEQRTFFATRCTQYAAEVNRLKNDAEASQKRFADELAKAKNEAAMPPVPVESEPEIGSNE